MFNVHKTRQFLLSAVVVIDRHFLISLCYFFLKVNITKMLLCPEDSYLSYLLLYPPSFLFKLHRSCVQYFDISLTISACLSASDLGELLECALGHTSTGCVHGWETAGPHPHHHHGHCADLQG